MNRRHVLPAVVLGVGLLGCTPKATEFGTSAERLLEDQLSADPGGTWTAACVEPAAVEIDTTFTCTATNGEEQRTFTGRITSRSKYVLTADSVPNGASAPTTAPSTASTTIAPPASG